MTDTPKPAPATPAATPMAQSEELWQVLKRLYERHHHGTFTNWPSIAKKVEAWQEGRNPAAAQPQRESEQPEQAQWRIEEAFREWWDKHDTATKLRTPQEMTAFQRIKVAFFSGAKAALSPQTDSQEPR